MRQVSILGTGWLGMPLAKHFVSAHYNVKGSTTSQDKLGQIKNIGVDPYLVNIENIDQRIESFFQTKTLLINIPSRNVDKYKELISKIEHSSIRNIVYVSSTSVYKDVDQLISENDGLELPDNPYFQIENLFRDNPKFSTTVLRFGGLIGYDRNPARFFKKGHVIKNPDAKVNMIHRDDCIAILFKIVERKIYGEVFNCCADTHPTKRDFYTNAALISKLPVPEFDDSASIQTKVICNDKLKSYLKYDFLYPDLLKITF